MLKSSDASERFQLQEFEYNLDGVISANALKQWKPDATLLVIDDFALFKMLSISDTSWAPSHSALRLVDILLRWNHARTSVNLYTDNALSRTTQQRWSSLLSEVRDLAPLSSHSLMLIPRVDKPFAFPHFRQHHADLASQARALSYSILNLTGPLSTARASALPSGQSDLSEIGHRICAEELYRHLHELDILPDTLKIKRAYRSRTDIRLLESQRYHFGGKS
jgi:hypothetical protein